MKFCSHCGKEIDDNAVICPGCGCPVQSATANNTAANPAFGQISNADVIVDGENPKIARLALVFSFLMPIVGLILGIIGAVKYKTQKFKTQCLIAIPVSIVFQIIFIARVFAL